MRFLLATLLMFAGLAASAQVRVFNSLTNLLATDPNAYMTGNRLDVNVLGYLGASDWGDQRSFTTTTDLGGLSTNRAHVFQNPIRPNFYHIANDRLTERQDARWFGLRNGTNFLSYVPLQAAADYCAMTSATDRSRILVIPKGDYGIERTVTIKGSINARSAVFHVFVPGFPSVGTNMSAFQVGDSSLDVRYADIQLPTVEWHGNTHSDGSTSFEFKEINYSEIRLARTFGSQYGMRITPSVRGFTWNFVRPGQHRDHKVTLALHPMKVGTGFVNDNLFQEGSYFTPNDSIYITPGTGPNGNGEQMPGYAAIQTRYANTTSGDVNNNVWMKPVIEGSAWEYLVDIEGRNNTVLFPRNERQPGGGASLRRKVSFYFDPARDPAFGGWTHYNRIIMGFMSPEHELQVDYTGNGFYAHDNTVEYENQVFGKSYTSMPMLKYQNQNSAPTMAFYLPGIDPNYNNTYVANTVGDGPTKWSIGVDGEYLRFKHTNDLVSQLFMRGQDGLVGWGPGGSNGVSDNFLQRIGPDLMQSSTRGGFRIQAPRGLGVNTLPMSNYVATLGGDTNEHVLALIFNSSTGDHSAAGWFVGAGPSTNQVYGGMVLYPTNYFQTAFSNRIVLRAFNQNLAGVAVMAPYPGQTVDIGDGFPRVQVTPLGLKINAGALSTRAVTTNPIKYLAGFAGATDATERDLIAMAPGASGKLLGSDGTQVVWMDPPVTGGGGLAEAPIDGNPYGRQSSAWVNLNNIFGPRSATNTWTGLSNTFTGPVYLGTTNLIAALAGKQPLGAGSGISDAPTNGAPHGRQDGAWTNLNSVYGQLAAVNTWTGTSNVFTNAVSVGGVRIDPTGFVGVNNPISAGLPITAAITNAGISYVFMKNASTDPASAAGFYMAGGGMDGAILTYPSTSATAGFASRLVLRPFTSGGNGIGIFSPYTTQTIDLGVSATGTAQVRLGSTNLSILTPTRMLAPTGSVTQFAVFADDATVAAGGNVRSITPANAANALKPSLDAFYPQPSTRAGFRYWDELLNATGTIGDAGSSGVANAGVVQIPGATVAGRPGLRTIRTSAAGHAPMFGWVGTFKAPAIASSDQYYFETALQMTHQKSGVLGDEYAVRAGFTSHFSGTNSATDGVWLTHQTNLVSSANWVFQSVSNNVATSVDTGVGIVVNAWYRLGLYLDATNALAYINGNLVASNTVASGTVPLTKNLNSVAEFARFGGTTTMDVNLDWLVFDWKGAAR
jgi:hypothetical protein